MGNTDSRSPPSKPAATRDLRHRQLEPELLDVLPTDDPRAQRSRRELRLINRLMGHHGILAAAMRRVTVAHQRPLRRIVELGAGDGTLMLALAKRLAKAWPATEVLLVDQQALVTTDTLRAYEDLGWQAEAVTLDLLNADDASSLPRSDLMLANLVLHHFDEPSLQRLFKVVADRSDAFIAAEPRRSLPGLLGSRAMPLIGCGPVTRHDAEISVRAGFTGDALSNLWPTADGWRLNERRAGLFTHLFTATRTSVRFVETNDAV